MEKIGRGLYYTVIQMTDNMQRFKMPSLILLTLAISVASCNKTETYAEKKARESEQIQGFISERNIKVIKLDEFLKDTITDNPEEGPDKTLNEYVLFPENGVYMQIVRRGEGTALDDGETRLFNVRFLEYNIATGDTIDMSLHTNDSEVVKCTRTGSYYTAVLLPGSRMSRYGNSVPSGWLVPMPFITPGFVYNGLNASKIKIIVPHDQGTTTAMNAVQPYYYELIITSQKK